MARSPARALSHAKITPRRSSSRGHAQHGWLDSYHTFSFAQYSDPRFQSFGALRVLNEDRVKAGTGFPMHQHRDAEIFSYILSGELTHRDSMHGRTSTSRPSPSATNNNDSFSRLHRGDIQFTTGGSGISHSEQNEHPSAPVHFLQIWALPWKKGLTPIYHTQSFSEDEKRSRFIPLISPLRAGPSATPADEKAAVPTIQGTIPIHADFLMGAAIVPPGKAFAWTIGGANGGHGGHGENEGEDVIRSKANRKTYIHLPMTQRGASKIRIAGRSSSSEGEGEEGEGVVLEEGDGAFVENVNAGDELLVHSVGEVEAEVVVLDSE